VDPQGRATYLERFIHGEIYRVRPDVRAIVHNHSPSVIPFGVTGAQLRPLYHMSAFLWPGVPVFEIRSAGGPATDMRIAAENAEQGGALESVLARVHGVAGVAALKYDLAVFRVRARAGERCQQHGGGQSGGKPRHFRR